MMTFLNLTQPVAVLGPIQKDLHTSSAQLVWIASIYAMAVASLVLSTGTIGDLLGRRRIFALGVAILGAGSLVSFFSDSAGLLIASQAFAGVGGAMMIPNALALVTQAFADPQERSSAVAIWATVSGVGLALGPLTAGALLRAFSWHSVFLVNVALAIAVLALTRPLVTESSRVARKLDPPGLVLAVIAVGALNYGVIEGGNDGFGATKIVVAFIVTVLAIAALIVAERRSRSPMLNLQLFRNRSFVTSNIASFLVQYAFVGIAIAQALWFEQVRHTSVLGMGLRILPMMGAFVLTSTPAGQLARRFGFKLTITLGFVLIAASALLMTDQTPHTSDLTTAILLGVLGVGAGLALPSTVAAAVISVPHSEGGVASASVNMFRQVGSALGASITGTIITTGIALRLPDALANHGVPTGARAAITHAVVADQSPHGVPAGIRPAIEAAAGSSFAGALHIAVLSVGVASVIMLVATALLLGNRPRPTAAPRTGTAPSGHVVAS
jgi:DHA2 family multidrug resistance protein-like MFS transporter